MKKKFFNAKFYRHDDATQMVVESEKTTQIGIGLPKCENESSVFEAIRKRV